MIERIVTPPLPQTGPVTAVATELKLVPEVALRVPEGMGESASTSVPLPAPGMTEPPLMGVTSARVGVGVVLRHDHRKSA